METKTPRSVFWIVFLCVFLFLGSTAIGKAAQPAVVNPDIVIKISHLNKTLNVIGGILDAISGDRGISPTDMLEKMLHGLEWIDFSRLIVVGIELKDPKPNGVAFIPFKTPSENFKNTWGATAGLDYYLVPFPIGENVNPELLASALEKASESESNASLSVEVAVAGLLEKAEGSISRLLTQVENLPLKAGDANIPISSQDLGDMLTKSLQTAEQLESVSMRLNLDNVRFTSEIEAKALDGSELAALFTKETAPAFLNAYQGSHQINFRTRSYDSERFLELIDNIFGKYYKTVGIDLSRLTQIRESFTGEVAGGISFSDAGMDMEIINVLRPAGAKTDFIETVYFPWLMGFGQKITDMLEKQAGDKMDPVFVQTPGSRVAGYQVLGMKAQFPLPQQVGEGQVPMNLAALTQYEVRMATVDNFVLTTSNDKQMAELISKVKMLKKSQAKGPLMVLDYDLAAYINLFSEMLPGLLDPTPMPQLDRVVMTIDASDGRIIAKSSMKMNDIRTLIAYFKGISIAERETKVLKKSTQRPKEPESAAKQPEISQKKKVKTPEQIRASWLEKGTLASAYGDEKTAIAQFQKAIEMDPEKGDAYFYQGISYGEIGEYPKAISALSRAVILAPEKGAYHYGRGRVYLISGELEKAMIDFKRAAALGNPDARRYLAAKEHQ